MCVCVCVCVCVLTSAACLEQLAMVTGHSNGSLLLYILVYKPAGGGGRRLVSGWSSRSTYRVNNRLQLTNVTLVSIERIIDVNLQCRRLTFKK